MTSTERIATALLGWKATAITHSLNPSLVRFERIVDGSRQSAYVDMATGTPSARYGTLTKWPNLTTLDGCRLFEDALSQVRKNWPNGDFIDAIRLYREALVVIVHEGEPRRLEWACILFATPAQRVAACIKLLDEIKEKRTCEPQHRQSAKRARWTAS